MFLLAAFCWTFEVRGWRGFFQLGIDNSAFGTVLMGCFSWNHVSLEFSWWFTMISCDLRWFTMISRDEKSMFCYEKIAIHVFLWNNCNFWIPWRVDFLDFFVGGCFVRSKRRPGLSGAKKGANWLLFLMIDVLSSFLRKYWLFIYIYTWKVYLYKFTYIHMRWCNMVWIRETIHVFEISEMQPASFLQCFVSYPYSAW